MANPPPPYDNITGISRAVMKDNAQETLGNYNGNARPGELVVDLTQDPPPLYVGNNSGQLTLVASGGGGYGNTQVAQFLAAGLVGNIIPAGNGVNSLGNSTNYWANLWVANNTIYLGGVPLGMAAGNVLTVNGNAVLQNNSNTAISTTGNITANYFIGNGSQLTGISTSFDLEMHVSKNGNDSTGTGTILRPYLTITHALTQVAGGRNTIVIHPGGYTENPTITNLATQLITYDATGASTLVYGTVTIANTTGRIAGLKMTNLAITGNAQAYINSSTVDEQFTKSSSGYVEVDDCELQTTGNVLISGSGTTTIIGNKIANLVVNNAGASVLVKGANDCLMPRVTAGSLNIVDSIIRASSNTANAVTASAGTVVTLMNNQIVTPAADSVARVSIAGFHSIISVVYDKANSTLSNSLNSVAYFQTANVDSLVSSGNVTGGNILTAGLISVTGNVSGNFFIGNGSQLTGITASANTGNVTFNNQAVVGTGNPEGGGGLYLAPGTESVGNLQYIRVRGGDVVTHIHLDTGNNAYFDQYFGDDGKYVKLEAGATGNIMIGTNANNWNFDASGNLTVPGNLVINGLTNVFGSNVALLQSNPDLPLLSVSSGSNGGVSSLWVEDIGNVGTSNIAAVYVNPTPGSGIVRIAVGQNGSPGPYLWDFGTTGNLSAPGNVSAVGNITGNYILGNGSQLTGITASVPSQTILPTIQTISVEARPAGLFGGGQGGANVTVANTIPVTEYGVIITNGTSNEKYKTGSLASIPGTVSLTFNTGLNSAQFTVFAYVTSNAGTFYSNSATGTSGICLLAGTQIALSNGTHKAIEHITYTDKMLSWDFDRGCYAETTAMWIKRSETGSQYNLLTFSDGTTLRTFDQHRIFNKQAGAFTYPMTDATPVGTITVNEHGQEITLINKQVIVDTIEYYNVITDHHMNLFSNSILTSCRFNNIYPIQDMKFVKDSRPLRSRSEFHQIDDRFFHGLRLAEQQFDLAMIEWYVSRLESLEINTDLAVTV